jgi:hypothetical protein
MPRHTHGPDDIRPFPLGGRQLWFRFADLTRADGYTAWIELMLSVLDEGLEKEYGFDFALTIAGDAIADPLDPAFPRLVHIGDTLPADPAERVVPPDWPTVAHDDEFDDASDDTLRTIVVHLDDTNT